MNLKANNLVALSAIAALLLVLTGCQRAAEKAATPAPWRLSLLIEK